MSAPDYCCENLRTMSLEKRGGLAIDKGPSPGGDARADCWYLVHDHWYGDWVEIKYCPFCGAELK